MDIMQEILKEIKQTRQELSEEILKEAKQTRQDLHEEIVQVRQDLHEEIVQMGQDLHKEIVQLDVRLTSLEEAVQANRASLLNIENVWFKKVDVMLDVICGTNIKTEEHTVKIAKLENITELNGLRLRVVEEKVAGLA